MKRQALAAAVTAWVRTVTPDYCQKAMIQLPKRWQKCIDAQGEYFEQGTSTQDELTKLNYTVSL